MQSRHKDIPDAGIEGWESRTSGRRESSWFADGASLSQFTKLDRDISVDVVVVGGGIAGMTTAYYLAKAGKIVAVLDDGNIGSGETGRTTAHLTHALDDRYYNIEKFHGKKGAKIAAESHTAAIDMVETIVNDEKIDCDFQRLDGYLFLDPTDNVMSLERELAATHQAGIVGTERVTHMPLEAFRNAPCIKFPNQAQFHPLKYLAGLALSITTNGGFVYTKTHVQDVKSTGVMTSDGHEVRAKKVVVATNAPIIDKISKIYDKQVAYRSYVIAARILKGAVPKALYWDTGNHKAKNVVAPYHYVRLQELEHDNTHDLLIVGGEDHETGNAAARDIETRYNKLEAWTRKHFAIEDISYRWSGQVLEPKDSMAFIGRNPKDKRSNVYIATGDSGNGMTHGTIAGKLLTDLILGKKNSWAPLYNPSRKSHSRSQAGGGGGQKQKKVTLKQALRKAERLQPGEGAVIEIKRYDPRSFYKSKDGKLYSFSAVCTHLGCTVNWNDSEKSFDCPCHGSRFSYVGQVINGPANDNLEASECAV